MSAKEYNSLIEQLHKKIYKPIYLLYGNENYYIDKIANYFIENVLAENEIDFNMSVLYGKDVDARAVISDVRRFPMMSNYRVVVVKEAQEIADIENLMSCVEKPINSTILVLCYKKESIDSRKKFFKNIASVGVLFKSEKMYENQVGAWISDYVKTQKYDISNEAIALLVESLGVDLIKIESELNKLFVSMGADKKITPALIEKVIGISKDFNVFELSKALLSKNHKKAYQIVDYFCKNDKSAHIFETISILYGNFSKIIHLNVLPADVKNDKFKAAAEIGVSPYFIDDYKNGLKNLGINKAIKAISLLREYDAKAKGVDCSTDQRELMKELVYKILN